MSQPINAQIAAAMEEASGIISSRPELDVSYRLAEVRSAMRKHHLDSIIISGGRRIRYFTGSGVPAALAVIKRARAAAFLDGRTSGETAAGEKSGFVLKSASPGHVIREVADFLVGSEVVGFDASAMTYSVYEELTQLLPSSVSLRKSDEVIDAVCEERNDGEVARVNAADVTHAPDATSLRVGETAVVSAGAVVDGYWAVESRTLGTTSDPQLKAAASAVSKLTGGVRELARSGAGLDEIFAATSCPARCRSAWR